MDDYGEQHLTRIAIPIVPRYWAQYFLCKNIGEKRHRFDFRFQQTQAGGGENYRATFDSLLLPPKPQCGWIRRKGAGDECGDQCPGVGPAAGSPLQAQPGAHQQAQREWGRI